MGFPLELKPKSLLWKCNGTIGLMRPVAGRVQMVGIEPKLNGVGTELKVNGVRCKAGHFSNDAVGDLSDNLQQQATLKQLRSARIIACLRASSSKLALDAACAALDGGLAVLEVTMNTPQAAQVIKVLVREYPSAIIGAGTVLSTKEADLAKDAGAKFLMSPVTVEEIVQCHRNGPVVHIPGAMTPTEVISAYNFGAPAVKLYPMSLLGGVPFLRTLRKPLGHIPMIPSNGVCLDTVEPYISAGAMAVILSEAIFEKSALEKNDMGRIRKLASEAVLRTTSCQSNLILA
ncbi:unnamed protein product [Calypogeia fissa]